MKEHVVNRGGNICRGDWRICCLQTFGEIRQSGLPLRLVPQLVIQCQHQFLQGDVVVSVKPQ